MLDIDICRNVLIVTTIVIIICMLTNPHTHVKSMLSLTRKDPIGFGYQNHQTNLFVGVLESN